jgi:hypothetical protein
VSWYFTTFRSLYFTHEFKANILHLYKLRSILYRRVTFHFWYLFAWFNPNSVLLMFAAPRALATCKDGWCDRCRWVCSRGFSCGRGFLGQIRPDVLFSLQYATEQMRPQLIFYPERMCLPMDDNNRVEMFRGLANLRGFSKSRHLEFLTNGGTLLTDRVSNFIKGCSFILLQSKFLTSGSVSISRSTTDTIHSSWSKVVIP